MFTLLFACAPRPVTPPTLGVPVAPTEGVVGRSTFGVGTPLPRGAPPAAEWQSSDPRVTCDATADGLLNVAFVVPTAQEWPYSLPSHVECTAGTYTVTIPVAWTSPGPKVWTAADGTLVMAFHTGTSFVVQRRATPPVVTAAMTPPMSGVSCSSTENGGLAWDVGADATATGGSCTLTLADGSTVEQRVAILRY